jgi:formiminotetrahydrofolate cyclodeaminase
MTHDATQISLLDLPASKLLDKFGAGGHKPGSGSAAALMGILSGKLIITVCKLTCGKPKYQARKAEFEFVIEQIQGQIEAELRHLFQRDAEVFAAVIKARVARDSATDGEKKKEHRRNELELLREATEIPLKIGGLCLRLIDHAVFTFDFGFQSARGDSGAAVSAAIAGVSSAAFVINLNLRSLGPSNWRTSLREETDKMLAQLQQKQVDAFSRVTQLTDKEVGEIELEIANL